MTSLYANAYSTRVGLVTFSTNAQNRFFLGSFQNLAEITQAIQSVTISVGQLHLILTISQIYQHNRKFLREFLIFSGLTNTQEALTLMRTQQFQESNGDRPNVANVALLVTDGQSTQNPENTIPAATQAKNAGIIIFT